MTGTFLVIDGIDGCGKTTQIKHLSNWLPSSGLMPKEAKLLITREPGGTALGNSAGVDAGLIHAFIVPSGKSLE